MTEWVNISVHVCLVVTHTDAHTHTYSLTYRHEHTDTSLVFEDPCDILCNTDSDPWVLLPPNQLLLKGSCHTPDITCSYVQQQ